MWKYCASTVLSHHLACNSTVLVWEFHAREALKVAWGGPIVQRLCFSPTSEWIAFSCEDTFFVPSCSRNILSKLALTFLPYRKSAEYYQDHSWISSCKLLGKKYHLECCEVVLTADLTSGSRLALSYECKTAWRGYTCYSLLGVLRGSSKYSLAVNCTVLVEWRFAEINR